MAAPISPFGPDWITVGAFAEMAGFVNYRPEDARAIGLQVATVPAEQGAGAWYWVRRDAAEAMAVRVHRHRAVGRRKDFADALKAESRLGRIVPPPLTFAERTDPDRIADMQRSRDWLTARGHEVPVVGAAPARVEVPPALRPAAERHVQVQEQLDRIEAKMDALAACLSTICGELNIKV